MKKIIEHLPVCILSSLLLAVWFEFILCFIRGYSELWYTILTAAVIVSVIATAFIVVGSELLIGFPDYTVYFAFVANGFALLFEIILIVYQIKEFCLKKRQDKKENHLYCKFLEANNNSQKNFLLFSSQNTTYPLITFV